jgi:hypothetical protein
MVYIAKQVPSVPEYNISRLNFRDVVTGNVKAVEADVSIVAFNKYPIQVGIPELGFQILVPNCNADDPSIPVADAVTSPVAVKPHSDVTLNLKGLIREIPDILTRVCPDSESSPLDMFLKQYMEGDSPTVFVRGRRVDNSDTPDWVADILSSITVPVTFPGRTFDNLIREFTLSDVNFKLPNVLSDPDEDDSNPRVSGKIKVLAALPKEMSLDISVTRLKATADVYYKGDIFGVLNLQEWQPANSTKIEPSETGEPTLKIESSIKDAPLNITDGDVFSDIISKLLIGGEDVMLDIKAAVDVEVYTALGILILKKVPAEGRIPVKRPYLLPQFLKF